MGKYSGTTEHKFLQLPDSVLGTYNAWDCYFTAGLVRPLLENLHDNHQEQFYTEWVEPLQYAVVDMATRGLLLDKEELHVYRKQVRRELGQCDRIILAADPTGELRKPTGKSTNGIGSTRRLGTFLFGTLGLKSRRKTTTGLDSTDQEALYGLLRGLRKRDEAHRPVLEALFHRSRLKTIQQRYLNLTPDEDGRVRAVVKAAHVKTYRYAYAEPPLQQFPPEARTIFRAARDNVLVSVDYGQLEPRIQAHLAGDEADLGCFSSGDDIYTRVAFDLGLVEHVHTKAPRSERDFAKSFRLGKGYGGAAETMKNKMYCPCGPELFDCRSRMAPTLDLSPARRKAAEKRWEQAHPAYRRFAHQLELQVKKHHYWDCPLGGRRWVTAPWSAELSRETKNLPMQFTAAQLMRRRQVELWRLGAPIVLQMHDEFVLECPRGDAVHWTDTVREVMERPLPEDCGPLAGVSFPTSATQGERWSDLKD